MSVSAALAERLARETAPPCTDLTPHRLVEADPEAGFVAVEFEAQPAFGNHFGCVQGGFAGAMIDVVASIAGWMAAGVWTPTVEMKLNFVSPLPIGPCRGEGRVIRKGSTLVFVEARLLGPDGAPAVTSSVTMIVPKARGDG